MDESLLELENELKRLHPCAPSAELLAALDSGLAVSARAPAGSHTFPATARVSYPWFTWQNIAAAAAVLILATVVYSIRRPVLIDPDRVELKAIAENPLASPVSTGAKGTPELVPTGVNNRYRPVGAASVLYDLREEGTATQATNLPVRRLRYRYVDTYTWKNPATNASLKWSLPRDEVRVLPASLH